MDRRNTNFPTECAKLLSKAYDSSDYKKTLKYYQILTSEYFVQGLSKGLYINHQMGLGKTLNTYHILFRLMNYGPVKNRPKKYIVIAPKSLQDNFKKSAKKYAEIVGNDINLKDINFIRFSHTIEKQIRDIDDRVHDDPFNMDKKADLVGKLPNLNGYVVVIEESHLFLRRLSHGSESMLRLYDLLLTSDCRIIMLSGSLVASSAFELVPAMNLLAGSRVFPENEEEFENLFIDRKNNKLLNKTVFQNRIYGLVSCMKSEYLSGNDQSAFPTELESEVVKIPMTNLQYQSYIGVRTKEVEAVSKLSGNVRISKVVNRFQSSSSKLGSYRVRSRQYCNFIPPPRIEKMFLERDYTPQDLINEIEKIINKYTFGQYKRRL